MGFAERTDSFDFSKPSVLQLSSWTFTPGYRCSTSRLHEVSLAAATSWPFSQLCHLSDDIERVLSPGRLLMNLHLIYPLDRKRITVWRRDKPSLSVSQDGTRRQQGETCLAQEVELLMDYQVATQYLSYLRLLVLTGSAELNDLVVHAFRFSFYVAYWIFAGIPATKHLWSSNQLIPCTDKWDVYSSLNSVKLASFSESIWLSPSYDLLLLGLGPLLNFCCASNGSITN